MALHRSHCITTLPKFNRHHLPSSSTRRSFLEKG